MTDPIFESKLYRHLLRLLPIGALLAVTAFALGGWALIRSANQGSEAHQALCTLRADLAHRVAAGRAFLAEHPDGFAGIPAATIRTSLANQQATVDALNVITHCDRDAASR